MNNAIYEFDPLQDPRWTIFLQSQSLASSFHTAGWLAGLTSTYGYRPAVLTTSPPGQNLSNGLVFCRVSSWITGRRLVSLPFSDHCEPLAENAATLSLLATAFQRRAEEESCKYAELRPISCLGRSPNGLLNCKSFFLHRLDLRPGSDELFRHFHRDCIQRKIRRAEREQLSYESGRTWQMVRTFYQLLVRTRRRLGVPVQPIAWFRNLFFHMGEAATVHLGSANGMPIAGMVTLRFNKALTYKYGASDERFHKLGAMPQLFWKVIQEAIELGLEQLDMGRSDIDNMGLITFKDRWGAERSNLHYWRYLAADPASRHTWQESLANRMWNSVPDRLRTFAGQLLYRHVG